MFTLDAEIRSEKCNLNDQKTKSEIKKEPEDSIVNSNKNKNTNIEQKIVQRAKNMWQKLFTNLKKLLRTKKVTKYDCLTTKVKYFRSCKRYLINASVS